MPARPPKGLRRHAAALLSMPALVIGMALFALPANAAQATVSPLLSSDTAAAPVVAQLTAPQRTARQVPRVPQTTLAAKKPSVVDRAGLVLRKAASLAGRPYHYGSAGPRAFDCSGYTSYVFRAAVGRSLPHSSAAQYRLSHKIAKSAIRPGDLVFFTSHGHVYHVGIYAGHGLIWHAPHSGDHVRLARISTSSWVAGRVL